MKFCYPSEMHIAWFYLYLSRMAFSALTCRLEVTGCCLWSDVPSGGFEKDLYAFLML